MASLWFVVPVHGRLPLARICLRQLRRTCDALLEHGVEATAVVIADRDNLAALPLDEFRFGHVRRDNTFLSARFNDGIQLACDPTYNPRPADYVVPCGSDDWVDWRLFTDLPADNQMHGFQHISFVREDGLEITSRFLNYVGGSGIRIYPRRVMERVGYRPADEDRKRACDTSILVNVRKEIDDLRVLHVASDPRQIVDWKSPGQQLNPYDSVMARYRGEPGRDPFEALAGWYPDEALEEMHHHYHGALVAA